MDPDEFLRLRLDRAAPRAPRPDLSGSGSPAFVGRVTTAGPTSANKYVKVNPVTVTGTETEGGPGTLTVDTSTSVVVLFLGPGTTSANDDLIVKWGDYRWVAQKKATSTTCGTITFTVRGCNDGTAPPFGPIPRALPGATVTTYDGNNNTFPVLGVQATNSSGVAVQPISAAKTYFYEVAGAGFTTATGTVAAACSGSSNTPVGRTLTVNSATHVCWFTDCANPMPKTIYLYDPVYGGLITMTWGTNSWAGSRTITTNAYDAGCTGSLASRTVTLSYLVIPFGNTAPKFDMAVAEPFCTVGGVNWPLGNTPGFGGETPSRPAFPTSACTPLAASQVLDFSACSPNVLQAIYGTGTHTFSISE